MPKIVSLGRVAVLDRGESGRRVLRAARELARDGRAGAAVAVHGPGEERTPFAREADEAVKIEGSPELALHLARADAAWLGPASLADRAAFAEACAQLGVLKIGFPAAALRRLCEPGALSTLALASGVAAASAAVDPAARVIEVVVAAATGGAPVVVGAADASLALGGRVLLAEAPPPRLTPAEEAALADAARKAYVAADLSGVAAVTFVLDPVSRAPALLGIDPLARAGAAIEAAFDVDLVRLALRLALGEGLPALAPVARAAAARVVSGDPEGRRAPELGRVERLRLPADPAVRVESAVDEGDEVPPGAAIATVVARGASREDALARLDQALADADVLVRGAGTSRAWLRALLARPEIRQGGAPSGLLARLASEPIVAASPELALLAAAIEAYDRELDLERARFLAEARRGRPKVGPSAGRAVELRHAGLRHRLVVRQISPGAYRIGAGGAIAEVLVDRLGPAERRIRVGERRARILVATDGLRQLVEVDGVPHDISVEPEGVVTSPMPAVVVSIPVVPGQQVAAGEPIARIESMKVEMAVPAPAAGVVREVVAVANTQVDAGAPLVRIEPLETGPAPGKAAPLAFGGEPAAPQTAHGRYLATLDELSRLLLGFDVAPAEAKRLAAGIREQGAQVFVEDPGVLRAEEVALAAFGDLRALFSRRLPPHSPPETKPPLEELWRYLHEPEARGAGLAAAFLESLRRALSHYQVSLDAPGRALELALLRIQKAHERVDEAVQAVLAILERRLAAGGPPPGFDGQGARALLDRLADAGQERFPALADLARELRYRRFDEPELAQARAAVYAQAEADLAKLAAARDPAEQEEAVERIVACPQPIATLLVSRMAHAEPAVRARLVGALVRRYYRVRPLGPVIARDVEGVSIASTEYLLEGRTVRHLAAYAPAAEPEKATRVLARLAAEVPAGPDLSMDLFLWNDGAPEPEEALIPRLAATLAEAGFPRPVRRASFVIALAARGLGNQSQQHLTFRGGPERFEEDRRWRGVHPTIFRRMQLARFAKFDLERLPAGEGIYLYRGVAQGNPKDERLFAVAEVRDLTPVRDAAGRIVRLPGFERMLHEALAGMRRFQARRAPHQRLEWNRVVLTVEPPLDVPAADLRALAERLAPATEGLGLEMVIIAARVPHPRTGALQEKLIRITTVGGSLSIRLDEPTDRPLEPMAEYQQRVVALRRRGLTHPFELVKMLAPPGSAQSGVPRGEFIEYDLDASRAKLVPVSRPPGSNSANMVAGVVRNFTPRIPEGMTRVILLGDPSRAMGSLAEEECRRIYYAIELADEMGVPLEWFAVSAGAKISMESGTENMDWVSRVLRKIIEFTQRGGEINVVVTGINVGAQPYWNAEATMLMHTRGILVMTPGSAMVLTGKEALEYSGAVSAEDNQGIGGYDRIMGVNGQAQYRAGSIAEAIEILLSHYDHTYVVPGERFPRRARTTDPATRDVRPSPHGPEGGAGFETVGDVFSAEKNPDRKKPFDIRRIMAAAVDQDHAPLERWRDVRGGDTAVVWDAHLGGWPVCLLGIESRPIPRLEFVPADGPDVWSAGTLFPQSSKKLARAINSASGVRPVVVLANLSGFDGSPESMRRLQLEYGAEIGRAVVNFRGPFVFCVVSRYHGGAFVVFSKTLREDIEVVAVQGARASVIGGAPAAAVVFAREVDTRARKDPRVVEAEKAAHAGGGAARARLGELLAAVRSEKVGVVADEFDAIHTVERALEVGSLDEIIAPQDLRPWLIGAVERGIARSGR
jgi:acetyl/propionyl-CoA carboxylase alpha subunit/acetyl-CoA carboxylase carboxyltransferase component